MQPVLSVSAPLQRRRVPPRPGSAVRPRILQRKCACGGEHAGEEECAECRRNRSLQRKPALNTEPRSVPPIVHDVLRSPGQPLDTTTRAFMEPRFGHDFGNVRVHTDARAAESAAAVNAVAYTVGPNIAFASQEYAPATSAGRQLLAHELAHVVQQGGSFGGEPLRVGSANDASETEAATAAAHVAHVNSPGGHGAGSILQRQQRGTAPAPTSAPPAVGSAPTGGNALCSAQPNEAFYRTNPSFCMDTASSGSMHAGFRCYREIPAGSGCPPGKHVCFNPSTGACDPGQTHVDSTAPSITRGPTGMCDLKWYGACSIEHGILDVIPALLAEGYEAQARCMDTCRQGSPWLQGLCMQGCTGGAPY